jgi:hypothetical protein
MASLTSAASFSLMVPQPLISDRTPGALRDRLRRQDVEVIKLLASDVMLLE